VVQGGPLKSKKGVNLPNTHVSLPCLTEKDIVDLHVALDEDVEWIGLSFVRNAEDIRELRKIIDGRKSNAGIVAKMEKPEAVADCDRILAATDAIMVARGDLGVEVPMESVPLIQKMLAQKAIALSKPVIVATQMMETMIDQMTPTRAEVNDVANSVLDGADAVMLSGETSVGKYPVEVVQAMARIIRNVEASRLLKVTENPPARDSERFLTDTVCYQASKTADMINATAIVTMTYSGYTAQKISAHRPASSICVFTSNRQILNKLNLFWGVRGFFYDGMVSTDQTFEDVLQILREKEYIQRGETVITVASMPIAARGTTNMMKISVVE
jgi:pyruvate kinase